MSSRPPSPPDSQELTRSLVIPNNMIVNGSVMTCGGSFIAGGGAFSASAATISLRRAMIDGQW